MSEVAPSASAHEHEYDDEHEHDHEHEHERESKHENEQELTGAVDPRRALLAPLDWLAPWSAAETRRLATELGLHAGSRVLEVGCGTGALACQLAREVGCHVTACDLDPLCLDLTLERAAREGVADRVRVRMADLRALFAFFPGERFDAVIALGAMRLGAVPAFARQAHGLLSAEGTLALSLCTLRERVEELDPAEREAWEQAVDALFAEREDASDEISQLEPVLEALATNGFRKGFAYEVEPEAWEAFAKGLAGALEAFGEAGQRSAEADKLFAGLGAVVRRGLADVSFNVYGGFPDPAEPTGAA